MENNNEMERLESFIDKILENNKSLKARHEELEDNYLQLQGEFEEIEGEVKRLRGERGQVEERVSGLIRRIEQWQNEYNTGPTNSENQTTVESNTEGEQQHATEHSEPSAD
ncbi:MAG: cell division protein ZapB [Desulfobulbaceae bacterium]|nr:cell division protein ZapB [Desulfobulbaceae bacterium]